MRALSLVSTSILLASLMAAGSAEAAPASPFRAMAGSWVGGGTLSMQSGQQERLRCRASYDTDGSEQLRLNIRCASDSYNIDLSSDVVYRGGAISGQWTEASHNASGTIEGRAGGDRIEARASGQTFSAGLSLTTRGNRQTISIRPEGTEITGVSLELARR